MGEGCWGPPSLAGRVSREWMSGHLWASHSRRPKGVSVTHRGTPCWGRRSCSDGRVLILTWGVGVPGPRSLQFQGAVFGLVLVPKEILGLKPHSGL